MQQQQDLEQQEFELYEFEMNQIEYINSELRLLNEKHISSVC
jgi:hypothetical protein